MIPLLGRLYREQDVILYVFGEAVANIDRHHDGSRRR